MVTEAKTNGREPVNPYFQIITAALSLAAFAFIFYKSLTTVHITDPEQTVRRLTPQSFREFGKYATDVEIGFHLNEFTELDFNKNKFTFNGILWFLTNIGDVSIRTLEQFNFRQANVVKKSSPFTRIVRDKLFIGYDISIQAKSSLNYERFPIDDHMLNVVLENKFVSTEEISFQSQYADFQLKENISTSGWNILDKAVTTGYDKMVLSAEKDELTFDYPVANFLINFKRSTMRDLISVIFPLLLLFFLALFSFSLHEGPATSIVIGTITATLGYRFIIESISPQATYFKISDYLFIEFLTLACIVFFIHLYDIYKVAFSRSSKMVIIVLLHILALASSSYLLVF